MPTGDGCVAINPESPSHNWQRTCPGVQCVRSGVLPTGKGLMTDLRRQTITSQSEVKSRPLKRLGLSAIGRTSGYSADRCCERFASWRSVSQLWQRLARTGRLSCYGDLRSCENRGARNDLTFVAHF
jgi:hypothetical protein